MSPSLFARPLLARIPIAAVFCAFLLSPSERAPGQELIRGDHNGDANVGVDDVVAMMNYFFIGGAAPVNGCGDPFTFDISDVNDNEHLTIADPLRLADALFLGGTVPPPFPGCGPDPSNGTHGFDQIDPEYVVRISGPYDDLDLSAPVPVRVARFECGLVVPAAVRAVELYFGFDPIELSNPRYDGELPLTLAPVAYGVIRLTLTSPLAPFEDVGPGTPRLGAILFDVAPGVLLPSIDWVPMFASAFFRRATVVDAALDDHHPGFLHLPLPVFVRGDQDGDGDRDVQDLLDWLGYYSGDQPPPESACDLGPSEAADVNDDEHVTISDYLLLSGALFCGGPAAAVPSPAHCGVDPDEEMHGFDQIDPAFSLRATSFTMVGAGPVERDVLILLEAISPEPLRAVEFNLDLGTPALSLDTPFFEPAGSLLDPLSMNFQEGPLLHVGIASACGPLLPAAGAGWQPLGTLRLHLAGTTLPSPIEWLPEATIGGMTYRATMVGLDFRDHHPRLVAGEREFQRGNANDQTADTAAPVDFGDPIFMLAYLVGMGPPPSCLDAGDANDDGNLDYGDPIYLLEYLVGHLPPMPAPFPACGFDLDIDELDCQTYTCP